MPAPVLEFDPETLRLSREAAEARGRSFAAQYQSAAPYHHICIDDFLPLPIVERVRAEALEQRRKDAEFSSAQEHLKASYNPDDLPVYSRAVFSALNSLPFIRFLEEMTGISGLIPDPHYTGAGIHRTETTGYLGIHADFNHHKRMNLERRLNVLIYLNPDWQPDYGGAFEVWTKDMKTQVAAFPPIMNRMCCFSTSSESYHGNPEPVNHPEGAPRLSIALYYYTATWEPGRIAHSTLFRPRKGSGDKAANAAHRYRLLEEMTPPVLYRPLRKVLWRVGL